MAGVNGVLVLAIATLAVVFSANYVLRPLQTAPEALPAEPLMAREPVLPEPPAVLVTRAEPVEQPPDLSRMPVPHTMPEMDIEWPAVSAVPVSIEFFAGNPALSMAPPLPPPLFLLADADLAYRSSARIEEFAREPLVRVEPRYPHQALQREMEGHALLEYTVTDSGTVRDIAVIETSHAFFADSARDAVSGYLYEPCLVAGSPVEVSGVRMRIEFVLAERTR